jgi:hypothetical protein
MPNWKKHIAIFCLVFFLFSNLPKNWVHHCPNHHSELIVLTENSDFLKSHCSVCDFQLFFQETGFVFLGIYSIFFVVFLKSPNVFSVSFSALPITDYRAPPFL